jgi:DNA-binding transcriptional regulator YbjK
MRMTPEQRQTVIITAALRIARDGGLHAVTHGDVAKRCTIQTSEKTVRHYHKSRADLWAAVVAADPAFAPEGRELGVKC